MLVKLDQGAIAPTRAHATDAGLDLYARTTVVLPAHGTAVFYTGVHICLPHGYAGLLVSKSGLNMNNSITSTGLIDEGYTGEIIVKLYNHSDKQKIFNRGDKISQLVIFPVVYETVEIVDTLPETERGDNGFGSSG